MKIEGVKRFGSAIVTVGEIGFGSYTSLDVLAKFVEPHPHNTIPLNWADWMGHVPSLEGHVAQGLHADLGDQILIQNAEVGIALWGIAHAVLSLVKHDRRRFGAKSTKGQ